MRKQIENRVRPQMILVRARDMFLLDRRVTIGEVAHRLQIKS